MTVVNRDTSVMSAFSVLATANEMNDDKWEYNAPQFVDFTRIGSMCEEAFDESSDYFST